MLSIVVNGRSLELPENIALEYSVENRLLKDTEGFSLGIDIPLRESSVNSEVFGVAWRKDADIYSIRYPAQIITQQVVLTGVVAIVDVSDATITIQFLQGKSAQNSEKLFEETYINELTLGYSSMPVSRNATTPEMAMGRYGQVIAGRTVDSVALPWVIADSGEMIHNAVEPDGANNKPKWCPTWTQYAKGREPVPGPPMEHLSYMPFLLTVAKRIASAMGYSYDFSRWESSPTMANILVCNTIPASLKLRDFSWHLPHWTINEFFENIEYILGGEFDIDHVNKKISFELTAIKINLPAVHIENPIDEFSVEIQSDFDEFSSATNITRNVGFEDNSSRFWKFQSCDRFLRRRLTEALNHPEETRGEEQETGHRQYTGELHNPLLDVVSNRFVRYEKHIDFLNAVRSFKYSQTASGWPFDYLFYVDELESYFIFRTEDLIKADMWYKYYNQDAKDLTKDAWYYVCNIMQVGQFGDKIVRDHDDAARIELKTVPVPVDKIAANRFAIFLPYRADESLQDDSLKLDPDDASTYREPEPYREIEADIDGRFEYYDKLYIGIWNGGHYNLTLVPETSNLIVMDDFFIEKSSAGSLRLNRSGQSSVLDKYYKMDESKLYKFSWLSDSLPNPRAVFIIKGKRYICSKLTASFNKNGMSQLLKGEFYRY